MTSQFRRWGLETVSSPNTSQVRASYIYKSPCSITSIGGNITSKRFWLRVFGLDPAIIHIHVIFSTIFFVSIIHISKVLKQKRVNPPSQIRRFRLNSSPREQPSPPSALIWINGFSWENFNDLLDSHVLYRRLSSGSGVEVRVCRYSVLYPGTVLGRNDFGLIVWWMSRLSFFASKIYRNNVYQRKERKQKRKSSLYSIQKRQHSWQWLASTQQLLNSPVKLLVFYIRRSIGTYKAAF